MGAGRRPGARLAGRAAFASSAQHPDDGRQPARIAEDHQRPAVRDEHRQKARHPGGQRPVLEPHVCTPLYAARGPRVSLRGCCAAE